MRQGREGADAAQLFLDKDFRPVPTPTAAADVGIITHFISAV